MFPPGGLVRIGKCGRPGKGGHELGARPFVGPIGRFAERDLKFAQSLIEHHVHSERGVAIGGPGGYVGERDTPGTGLSLDNEEGTTSGPPSDRVTQRSMPAKHGQVERLARSRALALSSSFLGTETMRLAGCGVRKLDRVLTLRLRASNTGRRSDPQPRSVTPLTSHGFPGARARAPKPTQAFAGLALAPIVLRHAIQNRWSPARSGLCTPHHARSSLPTRNAGGIVGFCATGSTGSKFSQAIASVVGHTTFSISADQLIWTFFEQHPLTGR
jgi:hypothetical protein